MDHPDDRINAWIFCIFLQMTKVGEKIKDIIYEVSVKLINHAAKTGKPFIKAEHLCPLNQLYSKPLPDFLILCYNTTQLDHLASISLDRETALQICILFSS